MEERDEQHEAEDAERTRRDVHALCLCLQLDRSLDSTQPGPDHAPGVSLGEYVGNSNAGLDAICGVAGPSGPTWISECWHFLVRTGGKFHVLL